MSQVPTVGRIVHYHGHEARHAGKPIAAVITEVEPRFGDDQWYAMSIHGTMTQQSMVVRLHILWPEYGEYVLDENVGHLYPHSETPQPGHWTWPPRG